MNRDKGFSSVRKREWVLIQVAVSLSASLRCVRSLALTLPCQGQLGKSEERNVGETQAPWG